MCHFKCPVQWYPMHPHCCAAVSTVCPRNSSCLSPLNTNLRPTLLSLSMNLLQRPRMTAATQCVSFSARLIHQHSVLRVHACRGRCQSFLPFFFFKKRAIIDIKHCARPRCIAQWFNTCVDCEIVTTTSLLTILRLTDTKFLLVTGTFNIYSLSNFQMFDTALLPRSPWAIASPGLIHLIAGICTF